MQKPVRIWVAVLAPIISDTCEAWRGAVCGLASCASALAVRSVAMCLDFLASVIGWSSRRVCGGWQHGDAGGKSSLSGSGSHVVLEQAPSQTTKDRKSNR